LVIADDIQIKHPLREAQAMSPIIQIPVRRLVPLLSKSKDGYVILNDKLNLNSGRKLAGSGLSRGRRAELIRAQLSQRSTGTSVLGGTNAAGAGSAGLDTNIKNCSRAAPVSLANSCPPLA